MSLPIFAWISLLVAPPMLLVWAIRQWWRTSPRIAGPAWRSYLAIGAVALVGFSELLLLVCGVWADVSGVSGYPDNSAFKLLFEAGFLAAPAALTISLFGKGTLRWRALALSGLMTFLWIFSWPWDM